MTTGRELVKAQAKRKGWIAAASGGATVAGVLLTAGIGLPLLPWIIGIGGGAWTGRKVYEWLKFRGEWGIRF